MSALDPQIRALNNPRAPLAAPDDVLRAIVQAVGVAWAAPKTSGPKPTWRHGTHGSWRFSGRTWSRAIAVGRDRPSL